MRQGPNVKRPQGRGNGRSGGNARPQRNGNNGQAGRGNARQIMEKYLTLARDASSSGDSVTAEGYFQHAEHYFRVMTANGHEPEERENHAQSQQTRIEDQPQPDLADNEPAPRE